MKTTNIKGNTSMYQKMKARIVILVFADSNFSGT